ncbi:hypothetical protein EV701_11769 [Chthoniobacter flavus]|uniref:hypothetical protein n=1 Tax=Chthoniobacter flavus TaxID=191863 RepID=UPI001053C594|nr:hypothetical protein [Chthoniobacter flavus]TCO88467.1 hypothetical protein EV701_11769 [Chthoniobacter flavus]
MQKPLALSIAVCLGLTSCQVSEKSKTWDTVVGVRPGDAYLQADPSAFYAEKLHAVLLDQGVEHCVVTYQYHYYTNHYEEAVGTRTAVVYRDNDSPGYPWWLKDDRTALPVWLPAGDLEKQISFYCRRKAEVIEAKHYPARCGSGKAVVPPKRSAMQVQFRSEVAQRVPQPQARVHVAERTQPAVHVDVAKPVEKQSVLARLEARLEKLFRFRNGTAYDPASSVDRRKMEQLKHGLTGMETTGKRGLEDGVDDPPAF